MHAEKMETTAHINFIAASYAAAVIVIGALVAWVTLDYRAQRRTLAELELQGFTRGTGSARAGRTTDNNQEGANQAAKERA
jgi:heme exporter protein D